MSKVWTLSKFIVKYIKNKKLKPIYVCYLGNLDYKFVCDENDLGHFSYLDKFVLFQVRGRSRASSETRSKSRRRGPDVLARYTFACKLKTRKAVSIKINSCLFFDWQNDLDF